MALADQHMVPLDEIGNMQHLDLPSRMSDSATWENLLLMRQMGQLEDAHIAFPLFPG
jgi:hypothetical protein